MDKVEDKNPIVTQSYMYGQTPLHLAASNGHVDIVQFIPTTGAEQASLKAAPREFQWRLKET